MANKRNKVGSGDERLDEGREEVEITERPRYVSEAAYRHHQQSTADEPEIRPIQMAPGEMDEHEEVSLDPLTLKWRDETKHGAK